MFRSSPDDKVTIENKEPEKTEETESSEYWVYYNSRLHGPCNIQQIIQMFTSNAWQHNDSVKFQLASHEATEIWYNADRNLDGEHYKTMQKELPLLYEKLIGTIKDGTTKVYQVPDPPSSERSYFQKICYLFTKLILIIFWLHRMGGMIFVIIFVCRGRCKYGGREGFKEEVRKNIRLRHMWGVCLDSGLLVIPLIVTVIYFQFYPIDSKMIAYLVWGISSFFIVVGQWTIEVIWGGKYHYRMRTCVGRYSLMMAGIDTGSVDLFQVQSKHWRRKESGKHNLFEAVYCVIPSMVCIIIGVVAGFITNYVLEQQFVLKCNEDIVSDICAENNQGCCRVISSWAFEFGTYTFISSMAGSIIGVLAIVKIMIVIFATGHPILGSMAGPK